MARRRHKIYSASLRNPHYRQCITLLRQRRIAAGITQQQVADALGWQQSRIARIEGFERRTDFLELAYMAHAIGATGWRLLKEIEDAMAKEGEFDPDRD